MSQLKGKFIMTVDGEVKPLFASEAQWDGISELLRNGAVPVKTSEGFRDVFGILEVAKGFEGTGVSSGEEGIMMIFGRKE